MMLAQNSPFPPLVLLERSVSQDAGSADASGLVTNYRISTPTTEYMRPVGWKLFGGDVNSAEAPPAIGPSSPFSICVKTTVGTFHNYSRSSLLHCGVSNSTGVVYHFDEHGLHVSESGWPDCVSVPILPASESVRSLFDGASADAGKVSCYRALLEDSGAQWDAILRNHHDRHANGRIRYHSTRYNCFNYVVAFFNTGNAGEPIFGASQQRCNVAQVASELIGPPVHRAELYLWLLRRALSTKKSNVLDTTAPCCDVDSDLVRGRFLLYKDQCVGSVP